MTTKAVLPRWPYIILLVALSFNVVALAVPEQPAQADRFRILEGRPAHAKGLRLRDRRLHCAGTSRRTAALSIGRILARARHLRVAVRIPSGMAVR